MKGHRDIDGFILACPCDAWQLHVEMSVVRSLSPWTLHDLVEEAIREHEAECIVLAATHILREG